MVKSVEFDTTKNITKVIYLGDGDCITKYLVDLVESIDELELVSVQTYNDNKDATINIKAASIDDKGDKVICNFQFNANKAKILVRNGKIIDIDCSNLIASKIMISR